MCGVDIWLRPAELEALRYGAMTAKLLVGALALASLAGFGSGDKPALRLVDRDSLLFRGDHFHGDERVTVTLLTGLGPRVARVNAASGRFRVSFKTPARGCGAAYAVRARGSTGTTAHLTFDDAPICVPPPRD